MKKIIYLLILLSLLAVGCGKDNTATNNQTENIQGENNNGISNENNGASQGDENSTGSNGDSTEGDASNENEDTTYVEEIPFDLQIELPEGTTVGDFLPSATVDGTTGWLLENPEYAPQREYLDVQDELVFTKTACGWIENHKNDGNIRPDGSPIYKSVFCSKQKNGYFVPCGFFCEVDLRVFSHEMMADMELEYEEFVVEYWCIIYKKDIEEFTWIYLDKEFFSKAQALAIADSLPETIYKPVISMSNGYQIYVDEIEGYTIEYIKESQPVELTNNETGETLTLYRHELLYLSYNELKEAENYSDWHIGMNDGTLLTYISGDVGCSIYRREARIPAGAYESGDLSGYTDSYVIIWGHRNSTFVYYLDIDISMGEEEVRKIAEAIHIEFEEPEE